MADRIASSGLPIALICFIELKKIKKMTLNISEASKPALKCIPLEFCMKKHLSIRINLFISITIVLGFLSAALINFNAYSGIIKDDIENISKLSHVIFRNLTGFSLSKRMYLYLP